MNLKIKNLIKLHLLFVVYAFIALISKLAAQESFLSVNFIALYGLMIFALVIYTFFWQKILKIFPLSFAFSNRSIVILWASILGVIIFDESITIGNIIGGIIIVAGVYLMVSDYE